MSNFASRTHEPITSARTTRVLALFSLLASLGCYQYTSFAVLDAALPTFENQPIAEVVRYLGYPTTERVLLGKKIYGHKHLSKKANEEMLLVAVKTHLDNLCMIKDNFLP